MRFSTVAAAVCLSLLPWRAHLPHTPALRADVPGVAAAPGDRALPPRTAPRRPAPPSGDAAAKHAKRTACLKDAKAKKLVGAEKTSFLKTCMAAP